MIVAAVRWLCATRTAGRGFDVRAESTDTPPGLARGANDVTKCHTHSGCFAVLIACVYVPGKRIDRCRRRREGRCDPREGLSMRPLGSDQGIRYFAAKSQA